MQLFILGANGKTGTQLRFAFFRWLLTHIMSDLGTAEEIVRANR